MSTYDIYLITHETGEGNAVEVTATGGKAKAKLNGKIVSEQNYVVGDLDDKLSATCLTYKGLVTAMLDLEIIRLNPPLVVPSGELIGGFTADQKSPLPERLDLDELLGTSNKKKEEPNAES